MKQRKRPTREQRKLIESWGKKPVDWLVERDTPEKLVVVHRNSDRTILTIPKGV